MGEPGMILAVLDMPLTSREENRNRHIDPANLEMISALEDNIEQNIKSMFTLSLQRMCMIKIVTSLYKGKYGDIPVYEEPYSASARYKYIHYKEKKVVEIIKELHLPKKFIIQLQKYAHCIAFELCDLSNLISVNEFPPILIKEVLWSNLGTVDHVKTFLQLKKNLPQCKAFEISCRLCLEDTILETWKDEYTTLSFSKSDDLLIIYWKQYCKGRSYAFDNHTMFVFCMLKHKYIAAKHFWKKLTEEEREESLIAFFSHRFVFRSKHFPIYQISYVETLIDSLLELTEKQRKMVYREKRCFFLYGLVFFWPAQEILVPTLEAISQMCALTQIDLSSFDTFITDLVNGSDPIHLKKNQIFSDNISIVKKYFNIDNNSDITRDRNHAAIVRFFLSLGRKLHLFGNRSNRT